MMLSDKDNLYIKNGSMQKIVNIIGVSEAGLYLTIKAFEYDNPNGIKEIEIMESSSDGVSENKEVLERLIKRGYAERTKEGLIKSTNKQFY